MTPDRRRPRDRPHGLGDGRAPGRRRASTVVVYNRSPDRATALAERIGARVAATPAEAASRADVVITMVADDAAVRELFAGPDGIAAGLASRRGRGGHEHRPARHDPGGRAGRPGARRRHPRRAGLGQRLVGPGGRADDHGRRRGGRPRAGPAGPRLPRAAGLPPRSARRRRGDEARGQRGRSSGSTGRSRRGSSWPSATGIDRALAYDVFAASAAGAPLVDYKRANFVEPETTPVAFSLDLAEKDLRLIRGSPRRRARRCRRRPTNLDTIRAAERSRARTPTSPGRQSPAPGGPAMTDRP